MALKPLSEVNWKTVLPVRLSIVQRLAAGMLPELLVQQATQSYRSSHSSFRAAEKRYCKIFRPCSVLYRGMQLSHLVVFVLFC